MQSTIKVVNKLGNNYFSYLKYLMTETTIAWEYNFNHIRPILENQSLTYIKMTDFSYNSGIMKFSQ